MAAGQAAILKTRRREDPGESLSEIFFAEYARRMLLLQEYNMAAWRRSNANVLVSTEEHGEDSSLNEDDRELVEEDISDAEFETSPAKKKKVGRKSFWQEEEVTDMVDIVCNSDYYKRKIIFTNSKNSKNIDVYKKLLEEMQERFEARGHDVVFTAEQVRNKFKKLIGECKKVALTVKTATGVDRFQEKKNYGPWFPRLFALVKTRDSCQPERAVEPTCGSNEDVNEQSRASPASVEASDEGVSNGSPEDRKLFVPVKKRGKKRKDVA
ncbi:uncharacterized protein LOC144633595 [Oculina patagonica]